VKESPDSSIEELRRRLNEKGLVFGEGTIGRFFERRSITRKKRARTPRAETPGCREAAAGLGLSCDWDARAVRLLIEAVCQVAGVPLQLADWTDFSRSHTKAE
jgi:hypothetical protein